MKILTIVGARPQFIKTSPVSKALANNGIDEFLLHTGQHFSHNMSDIFFEELELKKPDINLHINGSSHGAQTARMLEAIESVLLEQKPDRVLVYGDTNSTLAGSLAAAKLHIPVDHIEAGLRSFNKNMPEEINRILTDHLSSNLFAPSPQAVKNLRQENIDPNHIHEVGDVMYDSVNHFKDIAFKKSTILEQLKLTPKTYAIATLHRAENTDNLNKIQFLFQELENISKEIPVILPIHPRTKKVFDENHMIPKNIRIIDPLSYLDMLQLAYQSVIALTDSGGFQKEAFFLGVPCITLRDETEWVELVDSSWNQLFRYGENKSLLTEAQSIITKTKTLPRPQLYGNGNAASAIGDILAKI